MGTKWHTRGSLWTLGNALSLWPWLGTGTGYPEMLWSLTPLRQSKTIWTWFWANSSRSSCLSRGLEHMTSRDSFSPQAPCDFGKEKFKTSSIKLLQFTSLSQLAWKPPLYLCKVTSPHNQSRLRRLVRTFTGGSSAKVQWVPQLPDFVIPVLLVSWQFYISEHFVPSLSRTETLSLQQLAELHMHRSFSLHPLLPHCHTITERGTSLSLTRTFSSLLCPHTGKFKLEQALMIAPFVHWRSVSCYRKTVPLTWWVSRGQKSYSSTSFSHHRISRLWVQDEDKSLVHSIMEGCSWHVLSQSKWNKEL